MSQIWLIQSGGRWCQGSSSRDLQPQTHKPQFQQLWDTEEQVQKEFLE